MAAMTAMALWQGDDVLLQLGPLLRGAAKLAGD